MATKEVTINDLVHIGCKMAQELQDYIDAAEESGSDAAATKALLDEWEDIYNRSGLSWKNLAPSDDDEPTVLDLL
jgi:hypothetical protein